VKQDNAPSCKKVVTNQVAQRNGSERFGHIEVWIALSFLARWVGCCGTAMTGSYFFAEGSSSLSIVRRSFAAPAYGGAPAHGSHGDGDRQRLRTASGVDGPEGTIPLGACTYEKTRARAGEALVGDMNWTHGGGQCHV
jgi:hypothetical protein